MYQPTEINNIALLSSYLRTSPDSLRAFAERVKVVLDWKNRQEIIFGDRSLRESGEFVIIEKFYLPKKNKRLGYRIVYKLWEQYTKDILKVLKFNLYSLYSPPEYVHGFVPKRDTLTNAQCHLGKKYLLKLDIYKFFESIDGSKVKAAFVALGFNREIAEILAKVTTIGDILPAGYPTSPLLANMIFQEVDELIKTHCESYDAVYTRYADDISISSDIEFPSTDKIQAILADFGFTINNAKSQRFKQGQNQFVTGLSISDSKYPRIPKIIKKRLRQELHYIDLYGFHSHICHVNGWKEETSRSLTSKIESELRNRIKGWIDYVNHVEPDVAKKLYAKFNKIEERRLKVLKEEYEARRGKGHIIKMELYKQEKPILKD